MRLADGTEEDAARGGGEAEESGTRTTVVLGALGVRCTAACEGAFDRDVLLLHDHIESVCVLRRCALVCENRVHGCMNFLGSQACLRNFMAGLICAEYCPALMYMVS
ncbi:hypothetical protein [Nitratidesulfovibrio liaohensis]|uniref:Uncharacterized protein n=1 Tax=Nitratidesulfovibrio liaohensis TaxID=2604158 RepID=A0ABY9R1D6_9BACT|nr:hypothetical protein [Nitratidesulfovibrio liaohensis]WMW65558.1 hypothetical protein KPS_000042 [Nitratidesulfovibrio liaohensis]